MNLKESIENAASHLLKFQRDDGHFEGELSANAFPTCAYTLVQIALGQAIDDHLIEWFIQNQNDEGYWGLDASGGSDAEATLFAKLALKEIKRAIDEDASRSDQFNEIEEVLSESPALPLNLWIVKIMYARCGHISWEAVMPPGFLSAAMRLMEWLKPVLPKSLLSRLKPPVKFAPPVRLFYSPVFQDLFVAEKYTLVPLLLIMEIHTAKRAEVMEELVEWLVENRCADGSWFKVGLITAISLMALIDAKSFSDEQPGLFDDAALEAAIREGHEWLQGLRTSDGGCREAVNLNVWDTALSVISLKAIEGDKYENQIKQAALWLLENQNSDGGWPFSGLPGGNLPSDADDTALSTLALLKSGIDKEHAAIRESLKWLKDHQSENGGWGTYIPGTGDVSCVSITSHVIEACLAAGELQEEVEKAIAWLKGSISVSGYWDDLWLARNTYGTASAIAALVKSGHAHCDEAKRGIRWLQEVQNSDGGWGEDMESNRTQSTTEQTAWSTYALLLVEDTENPSAQRGIEYLLNLQNPDGSWPSSCVGIYWEVIGGYVDPVYPSVFALMALCQASAVYIK
jgi:squalene-hopene/tetraprenyl-beta-curcumene cyclase